MDEIQSYSIEEIRKYRGSIVYALSHKNEIFYIGKTIDASRRFDKRGLSFRHKHTPALQHRIRLAGPDIRVHVLFHMIPGTTSEDLVWAEKAQIEAYAFQIVNRADNPVRLGWPRVTDLLQCEHCRSPVLLKNSSFCWICLGALLGNGPGKTKQQLRDELEQIRLRGMGLTSQGSSP